MKLDSTTEFWLKLTEAFAEYKFDLLESGTIKSNFLAKDNRQYRVRIRCDELGPWIIHWGEYVEHISRIHGTTMFSRLREESWVSHHISPPPPKEVLDLISFIVKEE